MGPEYPVVEDPKSLGVTQNRKATSVIMSFSQHTIHLRLSDCGGIRCSTSYAGEIW